MFRHLPFSIFAFDRNLFTIFTQYMQSLCAVCTQQFLSESEIASSRFFLAFYVIQLTLSKPSGNSLPTAYLFPRLQNPPFLRTNENNTLPYYLQYLELTYNDRVCTKSASRSECRSRSYSAARQRTRGQEGTGKQLRR